MDTLQFVKLAVSKDHGRYNMTSVYRDTDCFVATDGHRLHRQPAPKIDKPHFIDGMDAEFPNYKLVLPQAGKAPVASCTMQVDKELIKVVQAVVKLASLKDKVCHGCKFTLEQKRIIVAFEQRGVTASFDIPLTSSKGEMTIGLNLSYFLDVLKGACDGMAKHVQNNGFEVTVDFYGDNTITHFQCGPIGDAILMPIRLDKISK